jgi:predicted nucleic acid-binding Zn ribbon protein
MNCAYCLEPLSEDAATCSACGRRQPVSEATQRRRLMRALTWIGVAALLGVALYWAWQRVQRNAAISDANAAVALCGVKGIDQAQILGMLQDLHDAGASWPDAAKKFRIVVNCTVR